MANDFVNTITTSNGTTYDVQDKRLTVTAADAGKVVTVDNNGNLSLVTPSGGTQLYDHKIKVGEIQVGEYEFEGIYLHVISTKSTAFAARYSEIIGQLGLGLNDWPYKIIAIFADDGYYPGFMGHMLSLFSSDGTTKIGVKYISTDSNSSTISSYEYDITGLTYEETIIAL